MQPIDVIEPIGISERYIVCEDGVGHLGAMQNIYEDGTYLALNPTWHTEFAPRKSFEILKIIERNNLRPNTIAEIGCGSGDVLKSLHASFPSANLFGYDISPQAIALAARNSNDRLHFFQEDPLAKDKRFDILLAIDVFEHVPDYMGFIARCREKAEHTIYHIPLELHVSGLVRNAYMASRADLGHLHYFSEASALATLRDTGHEIVDFFHTDSSFWPTAKLGLKRRLANAPRWAIGKISKSWSAKIMGGYSLLVLCR